MRRLPFVLALFSFSALAQIGGEDFSVDCGPMNGVQSATIKVVSPEGARAQVMNEDGSVAGDYSVPFNFKGRANTYYRFVITTPDGSVLYDRKLEAKQFIGCMVAMRGEASGPRQRERVDAAPSGGGMSGDDFAALLAAVNAASFSAEKTGVIGAAAKDNRFTCDQIGQLVDAMSFSADKLKALELTKGRLVDKKNGFKLLEHFTFSGDKSKAQAMLK